MSRKLSLLTVVFSTVALLFTACPIYSDPYDLDLGDIEGDPLEGAVPSFTGDKTAWGGPGYLGGVTVTLYWVAGVLVDATFTHAESPGHPDRALGYWVAFIREYNTIPAYLTPPYIHGVDVFARSTLSINAARAAALDAIDQARRYQASNP